MGTLIGLILSVAVVAGVVWFAWTCYRDRFLPPSYNPPTSEWMITTGLWLRAAAWVGFVVIVVMLVVK